MKVYFIDDGLKATFTQGSAVEDKNKAMKTYEEANKYSPHNLFCFDDETRTLYVYICFNDEFTPCCNKMYIVVRRMAEVSYPETVICENGIFNKIEDATKFAKEVRGSWKLYSYHDLLNKMNESEQIKKMENGAPEENDEPPFYT